MNPTAATASQAVGSVNAALPEGVITREEWVRRYADRVEKRANLSRIEAEEVAKVGAEVHEHNARAGGDAVVWWGGPAGEHSTPEDEADEEIGYWTDDE
jgi:hypothetical protein